MSFFDGIINAARSVLGIPEAKPAKREQPAAQERGDVAIDSKTTYEREPAGEGSTSGTKASSRPTLADRLEQARQRRSEGTGTTGTSSGTSVPPHLRGNRSEQPPQQSSPLGDAASGAQRVTGGGTTSARAHVYDAGSQSYYGTVEHLGTGGNEAAVAASNVQQGLDYYARTFGRDGIDGAGGGVNVLINDRSTDATGRERFAGNGGYYATTYSNGSVTEAIHFGRGKAYEAANGTVSQYSMLHADDLAIHELTHGIIRKETGHLGGVADESGATNEAIADVMAASATRDWRIGEAMYGPESDYKVMRNIANPSDSTAIHGLYTSMNEIHSLRQSGEEVEEHWASGVISTAAQRTQARLGGEQGWQFVERVFYDLIDEGMLGDMSFTTIANGLRQSAAASYGTNTVQYAVLNEELQRAGL